MNALQTALSNFAALDLTTGANALLAALGYNSDKTETLATPDAAGFAAAFSVEFSKRAQTENWKEVQLLFQLTADELTGQLSIDDFDKKRDSSFLFFALDLKPKAGDKPYSRTELANMARELNKPFPAPVIVIFRHGDSMSLASLHRRQNKTHANRDVLESVVLLKDIRLDDPHRAHLDILRQLADIKAKNWADFLKEWNRVLDISELNKRFFSQLSDWYFHARHHCVFPRPKDDDKTDEEHISTSLIRLITRVMFSYFLKERGLVPAALFDCNDTSHVAALLRDTDDDSSTYYKAVLQNLFFATLNTEMSERDWKVASKGGYNEEFMVHNKRRYGDCFRDRESAAALFDSVPFLNGGLFECLDKTQKDRYDGFSERPDNPLSVPNALFWGPDSKVDLTAEYDGEAKKPIIRNVRPLLNLFASYKWTVAENTPLEEEVALDPELLGKVFENLLASYNPETKATARKQSGSFYTPREIVDYMVTESLVAYLGAQTALDADILRGLFAGDAGDAATDDKGDVAALDGAQKRAITAAIEKLKLLDPAVGSGAFPMGALQSLVGLLQKIDPNNQLWRAQLESSARALTVGSEGALEQIAEVWRRDGGDYARKLYLIENCLFGVDIQPIAIQIAKLRFFIALAIEQKGNDDRADNFGIRPLPNLETKLVAANTLLELHKSGDVPISSAQTERLQRELEGVRADHFKAQKWKKKKELRDDDKRLRGELAVELKDIGMAGGAAELLAHWNPYDQNASAPFFDPRWMFGIDEGFDVVIGNPPYGFRNVLSAEQKAFFRKDMKISFPTGDIAELFIIVCLSKLVKSEGILTFIIPKKSLYGESWKNVRTMWLENELAYLMDASKAFDNVLLEQVSFSITKDMAQERQIAVGGLNAQANNIRIFGEFATEEVFNPAMTNAQIYKGLYPPNLLEKIFEKSVEDTAKHIDASMGITNVTSYLTFEARDNVPCVKGIDVMKYGLKPDVRYLQADKATAFIESYADEKLIAQKIVAHIQKPFPRIQIAIAYDDQGRLLSDTCVKLTTASTQFSYKFLCGYLQSRFVNWYAYNLIYNRAIRTMDFIGYYIKQIPIPAATASQQAEISGLVEAILAARAADVAADVSPLEAQIDALVYALYGLSDAEIALVEAA